MKKIMLLLLWGLSSFTFALSDKSLFFHNASEGKIELLHEHHYVLTLIKPDKYIAYTVLDKVDTNLVFLPDFIALWRNQSLKNNFATHPPSGTVLLVSAKGRQKFKAIITNPSLVDDTLTYQITVFAKEPVQTGKLKYIAIIFDTNSTNLVFDH